MKKNYISFLLALLLITLYSCSDDDTEKSVPSVTTATPKNISTTAATVGGSITSTGGDAILKSGVVYSSNVAMPTTADNKMESSDKEGDFSGVIEGLASGTTYHVRAFATNSVGTSYGAVVDFMTGNAAPTVTDVMISGTASVNETLTADYDYDDAEGDTEGATMFQWYSATSADGAGEAAIDGATAKTFVVTDVQNGMYLRVSITPKATAGSTDGAEVKSAYTGLVGAETVTFTYDGDEVTYGTIISTVTERKWLDRNLGAGRVAQSVDDYQAYGDLFQWGRAADKHQRVTRTSGADEDADGVTGITSTNEPYETSSSNTPETNKFIISPVSPRDWRVPQENNLWQGVDGANNPCPPGWRIPTLSEWLDEEIVSAEDAFSRFKMTYTGQRDISNGNILYSTTDGVYWSSTSEDTGSGWFASDYIGISSGVFYNDYVYRANGQACRCIKN
jgi:uncharacterized protein (TIGR02145 family)